MDRRQIIDALNRLAFAAELLDDDRIDPKAFSAGAWSVRSLEGDLADLHASGELQKVRTIGNAVKAAVVEMLEHERLPLLEELETKVPAGLFEVRKVKGLGPKKVRALWQDLEITSLAELEQACSENRLVDLKGFGAKTQEKVKAGVEQIRRHAGLARLDVATKLAGRVEAALVEDDEVFAAFVAGDVRRGKEIASEILLVISGADPTESATAALEALLEEDEAEALAPETIPATSDTGTVSDLESVVATLDGMGVRIAIAPNESQVGVALLTATTSAAFLEQLRERASAQGFRLESGRLMDAEDNEPPIDDDDAVFSALGLHPTAPERREEGVPLVDAGKARSRLIQREDLTGALHNHTVASDGGATLEQMRDAAIALGLGWLGISEHSQSAMYAGGLRADELESQSAKVAALNADATASMCPLVYGVESDILPDGSLDYDATTLSTLSHVIASVHARGRLDRDGFTQRMVNAAANPWTDIIGHPTGRLLLGRPPSDFDAHAMLDTCARCGTAVELNASPARLDLNEELLAEAKVRGVMVSIAADAHSTAALANLTYGISIARRAGLGPDDVLNARPLPDVLAWFAERKQRARAQ